MSTICWITTCPEQYFSEPAVVLLLGAGAVYMLWAVVMFIKRK